MKLNLKAIREKSGKTQQEVADDLGISVSTYRSWEQCKRDLNGKKLMRLADYFGVTTDDIIGTQFASSYTVDDPDAFATIDSLFYQLNDEGRAVLVEIADTLVRSGKYEKKSVPNYRVSRAQVS